MLEPILQQVGAGNPQLARLIGENPDQFLQLLSEDTGDDTPLPPGAQEISVTEEEREAIERVSQVSFEQAIEVFVLSFIAVSSWFRARYGHPSLLRLRQERGIGRKFLIRPAR